MFLSCLKTSTDNNKPFLDDQEPHLANKKVEESQLAGRKITNGNIFSNFNHTHVKLLSIDKNILDYFDANQNPERLVLNNDIVPYLRPNTKFFFICNKPTPKVSVIKKTEQVTLKIFNFPDTYWEMRYFIFKFTALHYVVEIDKEPKDDQAMPAGNKIIIYSKEAPPYICQFKSKRLVNNLIKVMLKGRPDPKFCCIDLIAQIYDKKSISFKEWKISYYQESVELGFGDILVISEIPKVKNKLIIPGNNCHYALYLGEKLYISLFGRDYLYVTTLQQLQEAYLKDSPLNTFLVMCPKII